MRWLNFRFSATTREPAKKAGPQKSGARKVMPVPPGRPSRRMRWLRRFQLWTLFFLGAASAFGGGLWLFRSPAGSVLLEQGREGLLSASARLGFVIRNIEVEGRERTNPDAILAVIGAGQGTPLFAIDPADAKAHLESLSWVRQASVERRWPDTLHIRLTERQPLAFWQRQKRLRLIDREGAVITDERLDRFPGLLVVVGEDAPKHAGELLDMLASEPDVAHRVTGAVWVGGRRWNLRFENGIDVQLPEKEPAAAWSRLAELERSQAVLKRDVQMIDMRLPDRFVLRVAPDAPKDTPKDASRRARAGAKAT